MSVEWFDTSERFDWCRFRYYVLAAMRFPPLVVAALKPAGQPGPQVTVAMLGANVVDEQVDFDGAERGCFGKLFEDTVQNLSCLLVILGVAFGCCDDLAADGNRVGHLLSTRELGSDCREKESDANDDLHVDIVCLFLFFFCFLEL